MSKINQILQMVCQNCGLLISPQGNSAYGAFNGYTVDISMGARNSAYTVSASVSAPGGSLPDQTMLKARVKECREVTGCVVSGRRISFIARTSMKAQEYAHNICTALQFMTTIFMQNGYVNVCERCGSTSPTEVCAVGVGKAILCESCYQQVQNESFQRQQVLDAKSENVVGGTVGALIGSLIGVAAIIIISRLGFVAAISGVIMGVCTLKGYEMLGGKLTKKGIVISIIIMLLMVYIGDRFDWAIMAAKEFGGSVFSWFREIPGLVSDGAIESGVYSGNLVKLYAFAILGAIPTILNIIRNKKAANKVSRMN